MIRYKMKVSFPGGGANSLLVFTTSDKLDCPSCKSGVL